MSRLSYEPSDPSIYFTVPTLAKLWDCPTSTIYTLIKTGILKAFKVGVSWRISDGARDEYENSYYTGERRNL